MALSSERAEPSETSPLLEADTKKPLGASLGTLPNGTSVAAAAAGGSQGDGVEDEEAGETEEVVNPIFEGLPEVAARLHLLLPAVGVGVSRVKNCPPNQYILIGVLLRSSSVPLTKQSLSAAMARLAASSMP